MSDAAERVRAAITGGIPPARKDVEHALRECFGLSARQARRFAAEGAKALGADDSLNLSEFADRLARLEKSMSS